MANSGVPDQNKSINMMWQRSVVGKPAIGTQWHAWVDITGKPLCGRGRMSWRYGVDVEHMHGGDPSDYFCDKCMGVAKERRADG